MAYARMLLAKVNRFTNGSLSRFQMAGSLGQCSAVHVFNMLLHFLITLELLPNFSKFKARLLNFP